MKLRRLWFLLQLAGRDMRGPSRARIVFTACLALGVAVMGLVGGLSATLDYSLQRQVKVILGGDIELVSQNAPLPQNAQSMANFYGRTSRVVELRTAVSSGLQRIVVDLKAIDASYPLYGKIHFTESIPRRAVFPRSPRTGQFGAAVDKRFLDESGLKIGDVLMIGGLDVEIRATIAAEPDRLSGGLLNLMPRVMINASAFEATRLAENSRDVTYRTRILTGPTKNLDEWYQEISRNFGNISWSTRDWRQSLPGVGAFFGRMNLFFTLLALTTLVTSGIGIGNATVAYLRNRRRTMAVLSCLGATPSQIRLTYSLQMGLLTFNSIVTGIILAVAAQLAILNLVDGKLPIAIEGALFLKPMLVAASFGALIVLVFSGVPLYAATQLHPAMLFRAARMGHDHLRINIWVLLIILGAVAVMFKTAEWATQDAWFTLWYGIAVTLVLLGFMLLAIVLRMVAKKTAHNMERVFSLRMALLSFSRPSSPTISMVAALGMSISLFTTLLLTSQSISTFLSETLPARSPAYYLYSIPAGRLDALNQRFSMNDYFGKLKVAPHMRGYISHVGEESIEALNLSAKDRWVIGAPLTMSYSYDPAATGSLLEGHWWSNDYQGPTLVSVESSLAKTLDLKVGDSIRVAYGGRAIPAQVNNIREVPWGELAMGFQLLFSPLHVRELPHDYIAAIYTTGANDKLVEDYLRLFVPEATAINVRQQMQMLVGTLAQASHVIWAAAAVTVLGAIFVCISAIFASMQTRLYDLVILQLLGATRRRLSRILQTEFLLIGIASSAGALLTAATASWALNRHLLNAPFKPPLWLMAGCIASGIALTCILGAVVTRRALNANPAAMLRND